MPQALEVDHEQVKVVAIQVGYREAARQFGLSENTVICWARREGWSEQVRQAQQAQQVKLEKQGMNSVALKTPADILATLGSKSKLLQAKVVHKTAKALQSKDGDTLIALTKAVKDNVDSGDKLFGYTQSTGNLTQVNINLSGPSFQDSPK